MAEARIIWRTAQFTEAVRRQMHQKLVACCRALKDRVVRNLSNRATAEWMHSLRGDSGYPLLHNDELRSRIFYDTDYASLHGIVGTRAGYQIANWLEFGTAGGKILIPLRSKYLRWVGPQGWTFFARQVKQGPIRPKRFMRRSYFEMLPTLRRIITTRFTITLM